MNIYQVGGSLRDELILEHHGTERRGGADLDFAVEAGSFDEMREELLAQGFEVHTESPQYLTIRCRVPEGHAMRPITKDADFTLCRSEGDYVDGRHPETVEVGTIETDLARRDFTMNAMARNVETGKFLDPYHGRHDIRSKMVCCVGDAEDRILREDYLRGLRALRFGLTLGFIIDLDIQMIFHGIHPEDEEGNMLPNLAEGLMTLPVERIYAEVGKMFAVDTAGAMERFFQYTNQDLRRAIFRDNLHLVPSLAER